MANSAPTRKFVLPHPGSWGTVEYAISANGKSVAEDFFENELIKHFGVTVGSKVQRRLMGIFEDISNNGYSPRMSPEPRKHIHGIKWEVGGKQVRIGCFQSGRSWVLTNGFFKPGAKKKLGSWPPEELDRAERLMKEHLLRFPSTT